MHGAAAAGIAVGLLFLGAKAADVFEWPFIHGWALLHGSIFVVFPFYFLVSYMALRPFAQRLRYGPGSSPESDQRLSVLAVSSLLFSGTGFLIPLVGSVLGIGTGHWSRYRCRCDSRLWGSGFAVAGLVLGYLGLAYSIYIIGAVYWAGLRSGS